MRLIDADELLKRMCKENCYHECRDSMDRCVWYCYIEDSPTAYDVKSVVKQLEEKVDEHHNDIPRYGNGAVIAKYAFKEAIEIVKSGGQNEN